LNIFEEKPAIFFTIWSHKFFPFGAMVRNATLKYQF
jgi:hypothetical protein